MTPKLLPIYLQSPQLRDNVLNEFYVKGLGLDIYTQFLSNAVQQVTHRYADIDILEIGTYRKLRALEKRLI
jgi:hypothetical protein